MSMSSLQVNGSTYNSRCQVIWMRQNAEGCESTVNGCYRLAMLRHLDWSYCTMY